MITITMPFDKPLTQKSYEDAVNRIQFHQLPCTCGMSGVMTIHGYYRRSVKSGDDSFPLTVCRVKCSHCGRTHALLPSLLVPYSQVTVEDHICVIHTYEEGGGDFSGIMDRTPAIDENLIASIIRRYVGHWLQKVHSFRLKFRPADRLVRSCFSFFMNQFMQIRQTPNILFSLTT